MDSGWMVWLMNDLNALLDDEFIDLSMMNVLIDGWWMLWPMGDEWLLINALIDGLMIMF